MAKFCPGCGSELVEGAAFCANCGTPVNAAPAASVVPAAPAAPVAAPVAPAPVKEKPVSAYAYEAPKPNAIQNIINNFKRNPKTLIIPGAAVVAIFVIVLVLSLLVGSAGYTSAINNYLDATVKGNVDAIDKLAPKDYWDYYEDTNNVSLEDLKDRYVDQYEQILESLEDEFGSNIKVSFEVLKEKELSERKLKKISKALDEQYEIDVNLKSGYELDVELTIKGKDDKDSTETELTVIKIEGKWYIINYYEYGDGYRVNFAGF